jgi:FKBP-type peptidyl-prolyl cis-trans isomerase
MLASNGKQFDSSYDRGTPFGFKIGKGDVIQGWDEGVMGMSLGEKAILHISSDFGYGDQGAGGVIPPNADLDFQVELLQIGKEVAVIPKEGCCIIL